MKPGIIPMNQVMKRTQKSAQDNKTLSPCDCNCQCGGCNR